MLLKGSCWILCEMNCRALVRNHTSPMLPKVSLLSNLQIKSLNINGRLYML